MRHKLGERKSRQHLCVPRHAFSHTHTFVLTLLHNLPNNLHVILRERGGGNHTAPGDLYSHTMSEKQVKTAVWRRTDRLVKLAFTPEQSSGLIVMSTILWPALRDQPDLSFAPEKITPFSVCLPGKQSKCKVFLFIWVYCVTE